MSFSVGDKVICTDASTWEGILIIGAEYVVSEVNTLHQLDSIKLEGFPVSHVFYAKRFTRLHAPATNNLTQQDTAPEKQEVDFFAINRQFV